MEPSRIVHAALSWSGRVAALGLVLGAIGLAFVFVIQPWYAHWGATNDEVSASLPGDAIAGSATSQETRAVTIDEPIERVWPWLAQLGQDRGGFYSFDLLENLVGGEMPIDDVLRPSRQAWAEGDRLWMYPPEKAGGIGFAVLREYDPGRALAFGTHVPGAPSSMDTGSWSFILRTIDSSATRLIVRTRTEPSPTWWERLFNQAVFSPAHFVMERRLMIGLQQVAESGSRSRVTNHLHIGLWTLVLVLFGASIWLVLATEHWGQALWLVAATAALFAYLTLGQPPVIVGAMLVLGTAAWTRNLWIGPSFPQVTRRRREKPRRRSGLLRTERRADA